MSKDPLQDGKSRIELVDWMGGDLDVVNDARSSFEKSSTALSEKDIKLIKYLLSHSPPHTSPLRGIVFKFKVKAPLFVCRQWYKHVIASNHNDEQLGWNEKSFRYVPIDDSDDFYIPSEFRVQSTNNKQASHGQLNDTENVQAIAIYALQCDRSFDAYRNLLSLGVGREQARGVLVPSVYTSWVWTVSLQALMNFIELRLIGDGAQLEIVKYAIACLELARSIAPVTFDAWLEIKQFKYNQ